MIAMSRTNRTACLILAWLCCCKAAVGQPAKSEQGKRLVLAALSYPDPGPLPTDFRLMKKLTLDLKEPSIRDVLRRIRDATQTELTVDENVDLDATAFHSVKVQNMPAWCVMHDLTQSASVKGRWVQDGQGYRLCGTMAPKPLVETERGDGIVWLLSGVGAIVIIGSGAWFFYRGWHRFATRAATRAASSPQPGGSHAVPVRE